MSWPNLHGNASVIFFGTDFYYVVTLCAAAVVCRVGVICLDVPKEVNARVQGQPLQLLDKQKK